MRDNNYRDNDEVKMITNQVWKSMSLLRGVLPVEHHHVYLFLLSAYYDGIIKSVHIDFSNDLHMYLFNSLENEQRYSRIMDVYRPIIKSIPEERLNAVLNNFTMFGNEVLNQYFDEIFDDLLFRLADNQGKYSGEFLLPNEISKFVMELAEIPSQATVFNPFAGLASFATHLKNNERYYGQEIVNSTWALGMLRLMRHQKYANIDYRVEDSIINWPSYENFDLVISNPPFNYKIGSHIAHQFGQKKMSAEAFIITKGLESINYDGKVVCVTSQGILFKGGEEGRLRQHLVDNGLIETIVSLPGGVLRHTGVPVCILVLTRGRNLNKSIRLIDATDFVKNIGKGNKRLQVEKLLNDIHKYGNSTYTNIVSTDEVRNNNYNLSVKRYFLDTYNGIPLRSILERTSGRRVGNKRHFLGKYVRTSSLKDNDVSYELDASELKTKEIPSHAIEIAYDCILVTTRWKALKPTLFKYTGTPIYIGIDILALEINSANIAIDIHYLINELRSSNVAKQLEAYQNPGTIASINRSDFFEIKIEIPAIQEQRAKVKGILELAEKFKLLQLERNALVHGKQVSSFNEFASLKHSLGTPRQNILSNAKSLIRFFESNNSEAFNEVKALYSKRYDTNLVDDLIQIKDDVNHISTILEKGENGLVLENYELKPTSLQEIDKALRATKRDRGNYKPQYKSPPNNEISGRAVNLNITLFKILINNVLSNADKYAFDSISETNQLIIELKATDNILELEMRNNGKPFPKNFDKEKFITKFSTTSMENGSGLGGYDINRIATYFENPDWELILNNEDIFPIVFRFNFPIIPMINE